MDEFREIQENLFDYFEDIDNKMLSDFINVFVYHNGTQDVKVSEFSEKFLEDNGLTKAYLNYILDLREPNKFFSRSDISETSMIDSVKRGLLSIAYNRFRKLV